MVKCWFLKAKLRKGLKILFLLFMILIHKEAIYINTCVSALREIHQSLQCKIFPYTFFRQYPMKFWDCFSLCKIQEPAWLQLDHKKFKLSEVRCSGPYIMKLKNTLSCEIYFFEKYWRGYLLNLKPIKMDKKSNTCIYKLLKPLPKVKPTKFYMNQLLRVAI